MKIYDDDFVFVNVIGSNFVRRPWLGVCHGESIKMKHTMEIEEIVKLSEVSGQLARSSSRKLNRESEIDHLFPAQATSMTSCN